MPRRRHAIASSDLRRRACAKSSAYRRTGRIGGTGPRSGLPRISNVGPAHALRAFCDAWMTDDVNLTPIAPKITPFCRHIMARFSRENLEILRGDILRDHYREGYFAHPLRVARCASAR